MASDSSGGQKDLEGESQCKQSSDKEIGFLHDRKKSVRQKALEGESQQKHEYNVEGGFLHDRKKSGISKTHSNTSP